MKRITTILLSLVCVMATYAQELNCNVTINSDQVPGSNKAVFQTLQQTITEFLNQTRWTQMTFSTAEKIDCSMLILVNSVTDDLYTCEMTIQSRRPVYGTSYSTPIMNFRDQKFVFTYQEYDRIEFQSPEQLTTNLSAMLAYYAYLIIAQDCDSYEKMGGTPYLQVCEAITSAAQSASFESTELNGWKAFDSNRNRYALINNLMDEAFRKYREYFYTYHRLGLDVMSTNVANGRARIAEEIGVLRDTNRARPATYAINTFLDAKSDELVNIFKQGTDKEKKQVYEVLMDVDPTRDNTYSKIIEN